MNPYSSPQDLPYENHSGALDEISLPIIRNIVGSWEKIRIIYNIILAIPGICLFIYASQKGILSEVKLYKSAILTLLCANLFYFAGPVVEIYLCALSQKPPRKHLRSILLIAGFALSFSIMLACYNLISSYKNPFQL